MDTPTELKPLSARQGQSKEEAANVFWAEFEALIRVFGERVPTIVACRLGEKIPRYPWKKGVTDILDDYRLSVIKEAFLEGGNLAVLLGKESHHLCVIDFDRDDSVEPFLALNPAFASTLRTRGSRGAAFWFYAENEHYPACVKRFEIDGNSAGTGEFRGAELAIFFGLNKARKEYQRLVDAPVIRFDYSRIVWPPNWRFVTTRERIKKTDASGNPIERKPFSGRPGEVDWDTIQELTENNDGDINDGLVAKYWPEAKWDGREWRCANIGGDKKRDKGSFYLTTDGWAGDFDGSYPRHSIISAIFSEERRAATGEKVTLRDFLLTVKATTGEDFTPMQLPILHLPSAGLTTVPECSEDFYRGMAETRSYFLRDDSFVYPQEPKDSGLGMVLQPMDEWQLVSDIQRVFTLMRKSRDKDGNVKSSPTGTNAKETKVLLKDKRAMLAHSLPLRLLSASPVLIEENGKAEVLQKGYHPNKGGIYVLDDLDIPDLKLDVAVDWLTTQLFADYDFVYEADYARAVAQVLSPAMKLGDLLGDADFPLDVALADQSQGGKTHRMKFTARIYGERPFSLTKNKGGVGSLDESVATALISGKLFILVDNVRGDFDSQLLESILRGSGHVSARVPHLKAVLAQTGRSCWQFTSNSANLTVDLTNRSIVTSHRKQPDHYVPKLPWGEEFIEHVKTHQAEYLGAVHAVLRYWISKGKPRTKEKRHAFTDWVQSMDWILQNVFAKPAIMDDHFAAVVLNNKYTVWLREVVHAIRQDQTPLPVTYHAHEIRELCQANTIAVPGAETTGMDIERLNKQIGTCMTKVFGKVDEVKVGEAKVDTVKIDGHDVERRIFRLLGSKHESRTYTVRKSV